MTKPFNEKTSETGSNSSNGGGSGNNSDNSALISLGNTSFGFNFDSEGENGLNNSPNNSQNSEGGDSDGGNQVSSEKSSSQSSIKVETASAPLVQSSKQDLMSSSSAAPTPADTGNPPLNMQTETEKNVARMKPANGKASLKRKASIGSDSGGYNSDDEGRTAESAPRMKQNESNAEMKASENQKGGRKKQKGNSSKREERNAREKERSFRISKQIGELQTLLSSGGVIVPKGTKSSVLTEAANYIRLLQQHHYSSEIDRHQLVQQIQMIGGGALGQQAATAVRHVAAQNGVWSLGNFGGMPPKSAMMYNQIPDGATGSSPAAGPALGPDGSQLPNMIGVGDYRFVFNSCTVGMAIASMGGAFMDCNKLFCQLSNYNKREVCSMTIFNLTFRDDLQTAFDLISHMLQPSGPSAGEPVTSCKLRGVMKHRTDLGLSVNLIKGEDGVAKCFCVTLICNPKGPYDPDRPVPATSEMIQPAPDVQMSKTQGPPIDQTPRYTTG